MDYLELKDEFEIHADLYRYQQLHRWLTYEGYSFLIWGGGYFAPWGLIATLAFGAAIVFIPIMIRDLVTTRHTGWLITWAIMVLIPTATVYFLMHGPQRMLGASLAFLAPSYLYYWMLRAAVDGWIDTLQGKLEFMRTDYYLRAQE